MRVNNKALIGGSIAAVVGLAVVGKKLYDKKKENEIAEIGEDTEPKETIVDKATKFVADHEKEIVAATEVLSLAGAALGVAATVKSMANGHKMAQQQNELYSTVKSIDSKLSGTNSGIEAIATFSQASMPTAPRVAMEEFFINDGTTEQYGEVLRRITRGEIK